MNSLALILTGISAAGQLPMDFGRVLDVLAPRLGGVQPSADCAKRIPTRQQLDKALAEQHAGDSAAR